MFTRPSPLPPYISPMPLRVSGRRRGARCGAGDEGVMRREIGALRVPIVNLLAALVEHLTVNVRGETVLGVLDHHLAPVLELVGGLVARLRVGADDVGD